VRRDHRERAALEWIRPYRHARHLVRTRDWSLELMPDAPEALVLAALTHDIERHFPGGPQFQPASQAPGDFDYRWQHSMRSAQFVHEWLYRHRAAEELVTEVETLILLHEFGGDETANVLQAADSLSFLETNTELVAGWVRAGRCSPERAKEQHRWMYERIRIPPAKELARPYLESALATVDGLAA
jgi:uncharacterized protein DUF4202